MAASLFRGEAVEFQRTRVWAGTTTAPPISTSLPTLLLLAAIVGAGSFPALGSYARRETVPGYLTPVDHIAKVLPAAPGIVAAMYVADPVHGRGHIPSRGGPGGLLHPSGRWV